MKASAFLLFFKKGYLFWSDFVLCNFFVQGISLVLGIMPNNIILGGEKPPLKEN